MKEKAADLDTYVMVMVWSMVLWYGHGIAFREASHGQSMKRLKDRVKDVDRKKIKTESETVIDAQKEKTGYDDEDEENKQ